jgi:predicted Zn-ribbon and HTH transcriptional regulator
MYRKGLITMLQNCPTSVHELALRLGIGQKEVEDDLHHLIKSLRNMPYQAVIEPATCRKCGFVFQSDKLRKPGKCPQCKGSWISEPLISIEEKR